MGFGFGFGNAYLQHAAWVVIPKGIVVVRTCGHFFSKVYLDVLFFQISPFRPAFFTNGAHVAQKSALWSPGCGTWGVCHDVRTRSGMGWKEHIMQLHWMVRAVISAS